MNLERFINENTISGFHYFEMGKTNPIECESVDNLELEYLNDDFNIYKNKYMDRDNQIFTYIFSNFFLHLKITEMCDTKEKVLEFFNNKGIVTKRISYSFEIKRTMEKFNNDGEEILHISYPYGGSKMSGYRCKCQYSSKYKINKKLNNTQNKDVIKTPLSIMELEEYL